MLRGFYIKTVVGLSALAVLAATVHLNAEPPTRPKPAAPSVLASLDDVHKFCEQFMGRILVDNVSGAIAGVRPFWSIPSNEVDQIESETIRQRNVIADRFGPIIGFELISEEKAGPSLMRLIYLEKRENHAIRWVFYFYRPHEDWKLDGLLWDDKLAELFH